MLPRRSGLPFSPDDDDDDDELPPSAEAVAAVAASERSLLRIESILESGVSFTTKSSQV